MFIYIVRKLNLLVLRVKNCVYTLTLCCGWGAELQFSVQETQLPQKKVHDKQ